MDDTTKQELIAKLSEIAREERCFKYLTDRPNLTKIHSFSRTFFRELAENGETFIWVPEIDEENIWIFPSNKVGTIRRILRKYALRDVLTITAVISD